VAQSLGTVRPSFWFDTSFRDPEEISDHGERSPWFVRVIAKHVAREGNLIAADAWIGELVFM
jgi:hypothetical protein